MATFPPSESSRIQVSVVTVTWNSSHVIEGFLASLPGSVRTPTEIELIVVDNASRDATLRTVSKAWPGARVVANAANRGLAAANNQGLVASHAEFILVCNPDVRFKPGAIDALMSTMHRHPKAGWVVPRQLHDNGTVQTSAGRLPSLRDAVLGRIASHWLSRADSGYWWDDWAHDEERPIERGQEAAYLVRRTAVAQVGLQDERYRLDWEGPDWTDRFRKAGWEIWLAPQAEVVHLGGASIRQVPFRWVVSSHRGMYRYFADRRALYWRPLLAVVMTARAVVKAMTMMTGVNLYEIAHRGRTRPRRSDQVVVSTDLEQPPTPTQTRSDP